MSIGIGRALMGATYGLVGYSFGKLGVAAALVLWTRLGEGNAWATLMAAPMLAALAIVWLSARGLADAIGAWPR
jgi:hypothetical protein